MVSCKEVVANLSNFIEGDLDRTMTRKIKFHLWMCRRCSAVLDSLRKVIALARHPSLIDTPPGSSSRLHQALDNFLDHTHTQE
jgi:Putative zinc-finger